MIMMYECDLVMRSHRYFIWSVQRGHVEILSHGLYIIDVWVVLWFSDRPKNLNVYETGILWILEDRVMFEVKLIL